MSRSRQKIFNQLHEKLGLRKDDGNSILLADFVREAIVAFQSDSKDNSDRTIDISSLQAIQDEITRLRTTTLKTDKLLADYLHSAVLLYQYSLAVPEYDLAIEPAARMLAAHLVSLQLLPPTQEENFSTTLIGAASASTKDIDSAVQAVSASFGVPAERAVKLFKKTMIERDKNAVYGREQHNYTLSQLLTYALQQYRDFHPGSTHRDEDLTKLSSIISTTEDPAELKGAIRAYLQTMKGTVFGSHLKTLCTRAIDFYNTHQKNGSVTRTLRTKDYKPQGKNPSAHVLAIHGLEDSLKTWDLMAQEWVNQGYAVHTYDQAGHGLDEHRRGRSAPKLDPTLMHFDLYRKIQLLASDPNCKTLHIYAHSFGGALVINSLHTITQLFLVKNKSVQIHLITPAAMKTSVLGLASKTGEDISFDARAQRKLAPSRQGAVQLFGLLHRFIRFLSRSFDNLAYYLTRSDGVPIHVYEGERDRKVDKNPTLKQSISKQNSVTFFKEAGHNPQQDAAYVERLTSSGRSSNTD